MQAITEAQVLTELQHHIGRENGIHVRELVRRITGLGDSDAWQAIALDLAAV